MSHTARVLRYMQDFGCMRLAARIADLKDAGYKIRSDRVTAINRYGEKVHFANYSLEAD